MSLAQKAASPVSLLRVHVDDVGHVWYGDDRRFCVNSNVMVDEFIGSAVTGNVVQQAVQVRLLGTRANAALIVQLQKRHRGSSRLRSHQRVQLCSPVLVADAASRGNPEAVLHQLLQPCYSSCLHGIWHDMTSFDYCTYAMIAEGCNEHEVPEIARRISVYHPAWPALSFIDSLGADSACRLLCDIVDPRWYAHTGRPCRITKLFSYLGLTPENAQAYLENTKPGRNFARAATAIRTWFNAGPADVSDPSAFLWRIFKQQSCGFLGLLRATQKLVHLVHSVWLHTVSPPHPEVGFDALRFFRDSVEAGAFSKHLQDWKTTGK